jgi:hypothetical protein
MSGGNLPAQQRGIRDKTPAKRVRPGQLAEPEWIMIGASVDAGKRIYASRDLPDAFFGITEVNWSPENKITAVLKLMLVITEPTYPECIARLQEIWNNWDAETVRQIAADAERDGRRLSELGWTDLGTTEGGIQMLTGPAGTRPPTSMLGIEAGSGQAGGDAPDETQE